MGGDHHGRLVSEELLWPAEADLICETREERQHLEPAKMSGGVAQHPGQETLASFTPEV